jgi:hypothetical protein
METEMQKKQKKRIKKSLQIKNRYYKKKDKCSKYENIRTRK